MHTLMPCVSLSFLLILSFRYTIAEPRLSDILKNSTKESILKEPTVLISIIARNSAHLLPNWLGYLENLDYPKNRISIWISTDHNEDNTSSILREWVTNVKPLYHRVLINVTASPKSYIDASHASEWTDARYYQVALLRQKALDSARKQWADYLFVSQYFVN
ncbi:procollagen galactosyltransferase 1-like [Exaiptasia diaphana]|uniref:Glycosyl transferase 64 domain-containing protein n=1 Tax=Exaiptasia diaphana TaxID=2652724 RepID=A0A913XH74_EXADI|nr:procollagen galactosyltransferase 1-like [Exaiptasia diaphana]